MRKFDTINVIPFIDIMLVLLAIVLTTATFISSGQLDITLPAASSSSEAANVETIEIAIDRNEKLYVDGTELSLQQIRLQLAVTPNDTQINLLIDETVEFKRFVAVIDLLKELALDKVSVITRKAN